MSPTPEYDMFLPRPGVKMSHVPGVTLNNTTLIVCDDMTLDNKYSLHFVY